MALSQSVLSGLIQSNISGKFSIVNGPELTDFCDAVAKAVVDHITSAAVVNVTQVTGVTPGGGTSGPGTGTVS